MYEKPAVVILAAGLGKRMQSQLPKVAVSTREMPMLQHVLQTTSGLAPERTVVVTGYKKEIVEESATSCGYQFPLSFAFQERQEGTGHAVKCAQAELENWLGTVLVLYGDVPLITTETLEAFLAQHHATKSTVSVISAVLDDPANLGRIQRSHIDNSFQKIVEAKDCSKEQLKIKEINSGIYAIESAFLWKALEGLKNNNAQGEYYLTDLAQIAKEEGQTVTIVPTLNTNEILGVNSKVELRLVNQILQERQIELLLSEGVEFEDIRSVYIDPTVKIAPHVKIGPNVQLRGNTTLEAGVVIEGSACLIDTSIGTDTFIKFSVRTESSKIGARCTVGPFAHLRPGSILEEKVKVGNFVETKKAHLKEGVSTSHLTYLGDCEIGAYSNIGAGTITCNYDGANKYVTLLEENVFIGSNTALVAPVKIGQGATVGAGSVITKDVPAGALAFTRAPQQVKDGYQRKKKQ
jgi:bifunctional UDP-N-acetylglucosamine pyrophosphorylase / glucosamine-1-phosphate N-acetyltransferase